MKIKLVAIDLDDTLLDSGLRISSRCAVAIERARQQGILVTLATGRMYRSARPFALQLNMDLPLITYQGALVKNALSEEILYFKPVPGDLAVEVITYFKEQGIHVHSYFDDELCMEHLTPEGVAYAQLANVKPVLVPSLVDTAAWHAPTKILAISNDEPLLLSLEAFLKKQYGRDLHITRSKGHYLEVMHKLANKAEALRLVAAFYGVPREQVLAIGDSYNDLDMITWAGTGIAVGNAHPGIKAAAQYITASNEEDGVAEALQRYVLEQEPVHED